MCMQYVCTYKYVYINMSICIQLQNYACMVCVCLQRHQRTSQTWTFNIYMCACSMYVTYKYVYINMSLCQFVYNYKTMHVWYMCARSDTKDAWHEFRTKFQDSKSLTEFDKLSVSKGSGLRAWLSIGMMTKIPQHTVEITLHSLSAALQHTVDTTLHTPCCSKPRGWVSYMIPNLYLFNDDDDDDDDDPRPHMIRVFKQIDNIVPVGTGFLSLLFKAARHNQSWLVGLLLLQG